ncbi:MAG: ATP-binding protein [Planctomycetaceae bacterium]|nr:ATP-binding protein [Planctomycetaceae bacterium]
MPQRWKDIHQDCLNGQIRECKQDCFSRADGSEVWLEWAIHPWTDDDGTIGGIVMFTNVITQRILTEKALEKARQDADAANIAKSEFLANMSHEIRTPLTAILGFTEHLRYKQTDTESIEICQTIERNGGHLMELINDILDLSKVEAGRIDVFPERCSPALLTCEIANTLQGRAEQKRLALVVDLAPNVPAECQLDIRRVRQILINLLGNAIKFTSRGSITLNVRATADNAGEWLEMAVQDTGMGIPSGKLACLFEAFSQIDSSTTRAQGGTGLGLCISRRLARLCGGEITVVSETDVGSTFTLRLPLIPVAPTTTAVPQPRTSLPEKSGLTDEIAAQQSARILVADDSPDNRRLLEFIFRRFGLTATFVENGQQLVDRLDQANAAADFDVVLVDMQMPVLDGYSAVKLLRERGCPLPLIALTANAMDGDRQKCLNAGCDDFATKPIDRQALLNTIASWAGYRRQAPLSVGKRAPQTASEN